MCENVYEFAEEKNKTRSMDGKISTHTCQGFHNNESFFPSEALQKKCSNIFLYPFNN